MKKMTPEEEREYWDAHDPLRQGKKVQIRHPQPPKDRLSYFALRLGGKDIDRLTELAQNRGMKPSEQARALILQGLEQATGQSPLERRVELLERLELEREVARRKKRRPTRLVKPALISLGQGQWGVETPIRRGDGSGFRWQG